MRRKTARQIAASKKNLVKARKARRKKTIGVVSAAVVAGAIGYGVYHHSRGKSGKRPGTELDLIRVAPRQTSQGVISFKGVGKPITRSAPPVVVRTRRKFPNYVQAERARVRKEASRVRKNDRQRMKYWKVEAKNRNRKRTRHHG